MFDERVMLVSDGAMEQDTLPQYKITGFTVYCMENHVCRFDTNLIDTGKEIYFSGYVKPVWSEDPSIADGVPAKNIGPIMSWWNAGYDGGDKPMTGFSTIAAEYILMEPSELYKPIMTTVDEKVSPFVLKQICMGRLPFVNLEVSLVIDKDTLIVLKSPKYLDCPLYYMSP